MLGRSHLPNLLGRLGALHHLPSFRLEALHAQAVVDGPLVGIAEDLIGLFGLVEQDLGLLLAHHIRVLVRMVDPAQTAVCACNLVLGGLWRQSFRFMTFFS